MSGIDTNINDNIETSNERELRVDSLAMGLLFAVGLTLIQRVSGLVRSILFCKFLPDEELGRWSLTFTFFLTFAPLVVLGLPGSFGRFTEHYRRQKRLGRMLKRVSCVSLFCTGIAVAAMIFFGENFSWLVFRSNEYAGDVAIMAFVLMGVVSYNFLSELVESLRQIRLVSIMRFISSLAFAISSVGLMWLFGPKLMNIVIGYGIGVSLGMIPAIFFVLSGNEAFQDSDESFRHREMWRRILPYAGWIWIINMITNLFGMTDRYMLLHISNVSHEAAQSLVGQYHSGLVIPMILDGIAVMVLGALMPFMTAAWEDGNRDRVSSLLKLTLKVISIGFTVAGVLILAGSPILFDWILNGKYNEGLSVLPMTLVYHIWFGLASISFTYVWCAEKGWISSVAMFFGLIANLTLNILLIPTFGLYGAVSATLVANGIGMLSMFLLNWRSGWKCDIGVFLLAFLPLVLLLDFRIAITLVCAVLVMAGNSKWLLSDDEKEQFFEFVDKFKSKIGLNS